MAQNGKFNKHWLRNLVSSKSTFGTTDRKINLMMHSSNPEEDLKSSDKGIKCCYLLHYAQHEV